MLKTVIWTRLQQLDIGDWDIRVGRVEGKWRLVYNIIGRLRVVLLLKKGGFKEFLVSTKNPEEVMKVVKEKMGGIK